MVIGIDLNEDVRTSKFNQAMQELELVELITTAHGQNAPRTQNRGSKPIDGIWVSPTLAGCLNGYLPFEFNHWGTWIDIPNTIAFGHNPPEMAKPKVRRLKCKDPQIVANYLQLYKGFCLKHNLFEKAKKFNVTKSRQYTPQEAQEREKLDK